jgi:RES domain-containing protein
MHIYRLGDQRHPLWDGTGAALMGGRWNSPGRPLIYGSLSYACAMLEMLAHAGIGRLPMTQHYVVASVPPEVRWERHDETTLPPGWDAEDTSVARAFGDRWLLERRSAILLVPAVVARLEWNALVNPAHPQAARLSLSAPAAVVWDRRLFERLPGG